MAFRWKPRKNSRSNLRRLARSQLQAAIEELETPFVDRAAAVHEARLHLKKLRSLVRLVREASPNAFQRENALLRDVARTLARQRDRQAIVDALGKLLDHAEREWGEPGGELDALRGVRSRWLESLQQETNGADLERLVKQVGEQLRQAVARIDEWTSDVREGQVVAKAFAESYRRARQTLHAVIAGATAEKLHEWRKQIKYHRYQVRLFQDAWPAILEAHYEELKRLSDLLGDDHDLVVLRQTVEAGQSPELDERTTAGLKQRVERRRCELQAEAVPLGRLLFAEKPKQLARRFLHYWCAYCEADAH